MELKLEEEVTIDPETGFPALPDNAYWEVNDYGNRDFYVNLKVLVPVTNTKPFLLFWKKDYIVDVTETVDSTGVYTYDLEDKGKLDEQGIREGLVAAATKIYTRTVEAGLKKELYASFVGKYPPKNLNQL